MKKKLSEAVSVKSNKRRVTWVDIAKGLCMFVVISAHTAKLGSDSKLALDYRAAAMSFHMPLYFILSAYTFRFSENMAQFKKSVIRSAKHLLIPSVVIFILRIFLYDGITLSNIDNIAYWKEKALSFLFASGVSTKFAGKEIMEFGMIWFLVVLFASRAIFDYLHLVFEEKQFFAVCMICSVAGVGLGKTTTTFVCFDISLAILPLLYFGYKLKGMNFSDKSTLIILRDALACMALWGFLVYITLPDYRKVSYLELAPRLYPIYPLCFIIAIFGTIMFCKFSCLIDKIPGVNYVLRFIGKNSMYLYMAHCLDRTWDKYWDFGDTNTERMVMRCLTDFGVFLAFMLVLWLVGLIIKQSGREKTAA